MIDTDQSASEPPSSSPGPIGPAEEEAPDLATLDVVFSLPRPVPDWLDVIEAVRAAPHQVTQVWYPAPRPALLELPNGSNANVLLGAPAYQVSSGEVTEL